MAMATDPDFYKSVKIITQQFLITLVFKLRHHRDPVDLLGLPHKGSQTMGA